MHFEVDNDLVTLQSSLTTFINFMNVLISAANIVYWKETDIHRVVVGVLLTTWYVLKVLTIRRKWKIYQSTSCVLLMKINCVNYHKKL